jgi:hypothetical protein
MLSPQVTNGLTDLRICDLWDVPQPFFEEYWGGKVLANEIDLSDLYEPAFVSSVV